MEQAKIDNYLSSRGALAYQRDHDTKLHRRYSDRVERRILDRMLGPLAPIDSVLDLPCGTGRLRSLLAAHGRRLIEADFSPSMLRLNADLHGASPRGDVEYLRCSALEIPLARDAVDVVVSVRLSHHFDDRADRHRHLREILRVARRAAIVTFFAHDSLKNTLRRLRAPFNGKRPKHTLRRREVHAIAGECGFDATRINPLSRLGSGHVYALLERTPAAGTT